MILVRNKHYEEIKKRIEAIRAKNEPKRLEYDCDKLKEEILTEFGESVSRDVLVPGRRYGAIGYSMGANAWRNGELVRNNGEIYLYLWTYYEDGVFRQNNAWGGICESRVPGIPLIEL